MPGNGNQGYLGDTCHKRLRRVAFTFTTFTFTFTFNSRTMLVNLPKLTLPVGDRKSLY